MVETAVALPKAVGSRRSAFLGSCRRGRQRQCLAALAGLGLIDSWTKVLERIGGLVRTTANNSRGENQEDHNRADAKSDAPIEPRKLEHQKIDWAARLIGEGRRVAKLFA